MRKPVDDLLEWADRGLTSTPSLVSGLAAEVRRLQGLAETLADALEEARAVCEGENQWYGQAALDAYCEAEGSTCA